MGDYKLLIWVVGIIGWLAYSFLTKKNSATPNTDNTNNGDGGDEVSSSNDICNSVKQADNINLEAVIKKAFGAKIAATTTKQMPVQKQSIKESNYPSSNAKPQANKRTQIKATTPLKSNNKTSGDLTKASSIDSSAIEEIDIRKAIIYSEILKTKFDQ